MKNTKTKKGFTLVEMLISVFIFVIVMTATVTVFVKQSSAHRYGRTVQKNLENAQFAFNFVAKTLRTSAVAAGSYGGANEFTAHQSTDEIYVYDFSQAACFHFYFVGDALRYQKVPLVISGSGEVEQCGQVDIYSGVSEVGLTTGNIFGGSFDYRPSARAEVTIDTNGIVTYDTPPSIGRVTVAAQLEDLTTTTGQVQLQTSVSLRDYPGELSF